MHLAIILSFFYSNVEGIIYEREKKNCSKEIKSIEKKVQYNRNEYFWINNSII